MSPPLLEALLIAAAGIASFGQIMLVLVLLSAEGGQAKAAAYAAGMSCTLLTVGEGALLLGESLQTGADATGDAGPGVSAWLSLTLGGLLWLVAIRVWRRPPGASDTWPGFFSSLDAVTTPRMFGVGALVGVVNFKNLAIYLSAIDALVGARLPTAEGMLAVVAVTLVFVSCLLVPIGVGVLGGRRVRPLLASFRAWLERHTRSLSIAALVGFGAAFIARGVHLFIR